MFDVVLEILNSFNIPGDIMCYYPTGNGHINFTYLCETTNRKKYILQRINNVVFKDVDMLMSNYSKVVSYLKNNNSGTLELIKSKDNKYYSFVKGYPYRIYEYIDNAICYEKCSNPELVFKAGDAFGKFHKVFRNFDAKVLKEVIPNFHNTHLRYLNLLDAMKLNPLGRVKTCVSEINKINNFKDKFSIIEDGIKSGEINLSVTHNDPKINNVLFDEKTGEIRAVIDLDTVMPGSYLYDFGDALRSLFTGDNEDNEDTSKLVVDYEIFEAYVKGYLGQMKDVLTKKEKELLGFSVFLLSIELAIRFLEDYIRGDVYFKTKMPDHNLIRSRTQIALAEDVFNNLDKLDLIVKKYA